MEKLKVLFVCSRNQWRSPTAEELYARHPRVHARSCGTSSKARQVVGKQMLLWADWVVVMEAKHKQRLLAEFPDCLRHKVIHVLDIPDEYQRMDPELVAEISAAMDSLLAVIGI